MALGRAGTLLRRGFTAVGVLTVGGVTVTALSISKSKKAVKLPDKFALELDLENAELVEKSRLGLLFRPAGEQLELRKVVKALHAAGKDSRVTGLLAVLDAGQAPGGLAQTEDLRQAVLGLRKASDDRVTTIAYADSFGEAGTNGTASYFLASAFKQVYVQPTGTVSLIGLASSVPFIRGLLDKWQVVPHFYTREEYKDAASMFTGKSFTPHSKKAMQALLDSLSSRIVQEVAAARGLEPAAVQNSMDQAPFMAGDAVKAKLIDAAEYRHKARQAMLKYAGVEQTSLDLVPIQRYIAALEQQQGQKQPSKLVQTLTAMMKSDSSACEALGTCKHPPPKPEKPIVALITACGTIVQGKGQYPAGSGHSKEIASTALCSTLRQVRSDRAVKAVVLRIDSPGGSAVASDAIHHEILLTRKAGKPVVVSMGNVAASGGYFIAAPASYIMAQPSTITGSIGVVFGKLNVTGALAQLGIHVDSLSTTENALQMSSVHGFTPKQEKMVNAAMDATYSDFVSKVASGRRMSLAAAYRAAKGRVWTGAQALELGLVDELGSLQDAIAVAKLVARIADPSVEVKEFPATKPFLVQLLESLNETRTGVMQQLLLHAAASGSNGWARGLAGLLAPNNLPTGMQMTASQADGISRTG